MIDLPFYSFSSAFVQGDLLYMTYAAVESTGRLYFMRKLFLRGYGYRRFIVFLHPLMRNEYEYTGNDVHLSNSMIYFTIQPIC